MSSSRGQDGSLGAGLSLPQWMKGKADSRFDFDHSSFSPPSHDDSFFYIRYPKSNEAKGNNAGSSGQDGYRPISQVLSEKSESTNATGGIIGQVGASSSNGSNVSKIKDVPSIDFSKHPVPCQPFVPTAGKNSVTPVPSKFGSKLKVVKSQGTDDGFHSEPALCGKSIVHVANRIMSDRKVTKAEPAGKGTETKNTTEQQDRDQFVTKGSQSLPVTPVASPLSTPDTSPKSRRRMHTNRYFTGAFIPDREKYQTGWILSSILGQSREAMTNNKIQEEEEEPPSLDVFPSKYLNRKKSISTQNLSYFGSDETSAVPASSQQQQQLKKTAVYTNAFQAKPSEFREMNFWSPTSM